MRPLFSQSNLKQRFSIAVVKEHVPLIRFRAQLKRTPELKQASDENTFVESTFHPNHFRKPISEDEISNFQFGGLNP
ncbi:hypothetical protein TcWFU_002606 [Taenia crassiceps]|uniref:Uncharacterized protein n=1 Tax=Taenia crassiceps TaxID=6207 RepID=A0ABR4QKK3_9CEST